MSDDNENVEPDEVEWEDGEGTVDSNDFMMVARAVIVELLMVYAELRRRGENPEVDVLELPSLFGILWAITRPDVKVFRYNLSGKVNHLPEADVYGQNLRYWAFIDDDGDVLVSFVEGSKTRPEEGFTTSDEFSDALQPVLMNLLVDKIGVDVEKARRIFDEGGHVSQRVKTLLDKALAERIEAEVANFRDEINSKLDTMFGGGDST